MNTHLPDGRTPVVLSAHGDDLLRADAAAVLRHLDRDPAATVDAVAGRLLTTRRIRRHRRVIRARTRDELTAGLRAVADGAEHALVTGGADGAATRIAFVVPGQGTQWPGMGAEAYATLPDYRAEVDACAAAFVAAGAPSPIHYLTTPDGSGTETEIEGAQFLHAVGLAQVWRSWGVLPDLTVGHSLGEIAAAYLAGVITRSEAVAVVIARASVVERLPGHHAVAVLGVSADEARAVIAATPGWLELAVVNAATSVAVSGDRDAVSAAVARVRDQGRFAREITVGFPVHTSILEPLRDELLRRLPESVFADSAVQFIGGTTGDVVPAGTEFAGYWWANLRDMVRFDHAFRSALRCGAGVFVELSAHPALLFAMGDLLGDTPAVLVGSGRRDVSLGESLSENLVAAAASAPGYDWRSYVGDPGRLLRGFPPAPMRATPLWAVSEPLPQVTALTIAHETWSPVPATDAPQHIVDVAVLDLGEPGPLGEALRAAADSHPGVTLTTPEAAELTVVAAPAPGGTDADSAVAALTALVDAGALRYPAALGPRCRDVWLVTAAAEQVLADDVVDLPAAALAAAHRSLGLENPDPGFHHLDLPAGGLTGPAVIDALLAGSGETALRTAGSSVTRYRRGLADAPLAPSWPQRTAILDEVVITGAAGAIGMHFARRLAEQGARRIVLLSRRGVEPEVLAALAEPHGAEVVSVPCDITDAEGLAAAAREYAGSGASLLIHAAGAATFATGDRLDAAATAHTLAAKVTGLGRIAELWPRRPDARILLCSSVSGLWGGHGHAAYSAANRMLDVMAARLRAAGTRCVSVRWGLWQASDGAGIVDAAETARIERSGLRPMAPEAAVEAGLADHAGDPLVLSADPHRLRMFFGDAEPAPVPQVPVAATDTPADAEDAVRGGLAAVLGISDGSGIDLDASLFDLGVDSLLALDLRKRFRSLLGRTVPLATLLGGITGTELVAELSQKVTSPK
ncbi:mycobactin polyketide synthase MbtD [Mycolicibacterium sp. F2034L]|uniref:mycobactin polyketide synthase MbtD n=1 Tax=Mycolicibacterium sp. F2034L TaxID=2926422 RepID=UPI001FF3FF22|nr:mycobactin polyketide synthase MbtD [Mycolicibacterium sp. F2034L]MCK0173547.1 mycobactin polyketide synthase MbtD [Mycolicibacterium sp. F2034L]